MKKAYKKILILFVSLTMVIAAGAFDVSENFITSSEADKWSDPATGVTYYSGPNLEYRFQSGGVSTVPWLQFQMPSVKIGCNGLSIKGGFMALIGLKDIKVDLTNAGQSFAWGVLTTIELSMPSVAAVFQKIQGWVRKIQQLLQNSCNAGRTFAKSFGLDRAFNIFDNEAIKQGADELMRSMDSVDKWLDRLNGEITGDEGNETKEATVTNKIFKIGSGKSFFAMYFGKGMMKCSKTELDDKEKIDFSLRDVAVDGELGSCNVESKIGTNEFARKQISYFLTRVLFGELVVTPESISQILERFNDDGHFDTEAAKRELKSAKVGASWPLQEPEYSNFAPVIGDQRKAAVWLIRGSSTNKMIKDLKGTLIKYKGTQFSQEHMVTDENASVANSANVMVSNNTGSAISQTIEIRAVYITRADSGDMQDVKWEGLVEKSRTAILGKVKEALSAKLSGSTTVSNYFEGEDVTVPTSHYTSTPLLVSGMAQYVNTISQLALQRGGVHSVNGLINILALYNSQLFAEQLLSEIEHQIELVETGPGLVTSETTRKGFADFKKRVQTIYNEIQKEIRAMKKESIEDVSKIPELFQSLDKMLKEGRLNKVGK